MPQAHSDGALHSIGDVRLMKFVLSSGATGQEVTEAFGSALSASLEHELRGALVIAEGRPAMPLPELKAAVNVPDFANCPDDFRLALVAFRETTYQAYRYALGSLMKRGVCRIFNDELEAMEWLRGEFPEP